MSLAPFGSAKLKVNAVPPPFAAAGVTVPAVGARLFARSGTNQVPTVLPKPPLLRRPPLSATIALETRFPVRTGLKVTGTVRVSSLAAPTAVNPVPLIEQKLFSRVWEEPKARGPSQAFPASF